MERKKWLLQNLISVLYLKAPFNKVTYEPVGNTEALKYFTVSADGQVYAQLSLQNDNDQQRDFTVWTFYISVIFILYLEFLSYFAFQPVLHDWCNKGCGMCYPVCGMVHIK